ncbi:MAG: hypothetical protein QOF76_3520 [Solirubrobacteraceae bacterium]|nr:hypothetical protein [Solirubrobacteraceae bacterium]
MRLGKDPWKEGVQTTATIERVLVTRFCEGDTADNATDPVTFLTFRFADEQGATVLQERRYAIKGSIPVPGSTVTVAYMPDKRDKLEWDRHTVAAPDPAVPRGWSGGAFEVPDLGGVRPGDRFPVVSYFSGKPIIENWDPHALDLQRELFRTGRRTRATITGVRRTGRGWHNVWERALTLQTPEQAYEAPVFLCYVPKPGDEIEIALSPDGAHIALDSDERFLADGAAQGLVWTTPADVAYARSPEGQRAQMDAIAQAGEEQGKIMRLEAIAESLRKGDITQAQFEAVKTQILAGTPAPPSPEELTARLDAAYAAGQISKFQYQAMKRVNERRAR